MGAKGGVGFRAVRGGSVNLIQPVRPCMTLIRRGTCTLRLRPLSRNKTEIRVRESVVVVCRQISALAGGSRVRRSRPPNEKKEVFRLRLQIVIYLGKLHCAKGRHGSGFLANGLGWVKVSKCLHGSTQPVGHKNGSMKHFE